MYNYNHSNTFTVRGQIGLEQDLRAHRDRALKLLQENQAQSREALEHLVKERLTKLTTTASPGRALNNDQLQAFYSEVVDLSYIMFSLGFTMAHAAKR